MNAKLLAPVLVSLLAAPALADKAAPPAPMAKMVVTPAAKLVWTPLDPKQPKGLQTSLVHGDMQKGPVSFFLKLPAGAKSGLHAHSNDYYSVVVAGSPGHGANEKEATTALAVGSSWFQPAKEMHFDICNSKQDCILLLEYPSGGFDFIPGPAEPAKKK